MGQVMGTLKIKKIYCCVNKNEEVLITIYRQHNVANIFQNVQKKITIIHFMAWSINTKLWPNSPASLTDP